MAVYGFSRAIWGNVTSEHTGNNASDVRSQSRNQFYLNQPGIRKRAVKTSLFGCRTGGPDNLRTQQSIPTRSKNLQ